MILSYGELTYGCLLYHCIDVQQFDVEVKIDDSLAMYLSASVIARFPMNAGVSAKFRGRDYNLEVAGSNPVPAIYTCLSVAHCGTVAFLCSNRLLSVEPAVLLVTARVRI